MAETRGFVRGSLLRLLLQQYVPRAAAAVRLAAGGAHLFWLQLQPAAPLSLHALLTPVSTASLGSSVAIAACLLHGRPSAGPLHVAFSPAIAVGELSRPPAAVSMCMPAPSPLTSCTFAASTTAAAVPAAGRTASRTFTFRAAPVFLHQAPAVSSSSSSSGASPAARLRRASASGCSDAVASPGAASSSLCSSTEAAAGSAFPTPVAAAAAAAPASPSSPPSRSGVAGAAPPAVVAAASSAAFASAGARGPYRSAFVGTPAAAVEAAAALAASYLLPGRRRKPWPAAAPHVLQRHAAFRPSGGRFTAGRYAAGVRAPGRYVVGRQAAAAALLRRAAASSAAAATAAPAATPAARSPLQVTGAAATHPPPAGAASAAVAETPAAATSGAGRLAADTKKQQRASAGGGSTAGAAAEEGAAKEEETPESRTAAVKEERRGSRVDSNDDVEEEEREEEEKTAAGAGGQGAATGAAARVKTTAAAKSATLGVETAEEEDAAAAGAPVVAAAAAEREEGRRRAGGGIQGAAAGRKGRRETTRREGEDLADGAAAGTAGRETQQQRGQEEKQQLAKTNKQQQEERAKQQREKEEEQQQENEIKEEKAAGGRITADAIEPLATALPEAPMRKKRRESGASNTKIGRKVRRRRMASLPWKVWGHVFAFAALPMIGFGVMDQFIMLRLGDFIDTTIGVALGVTTLAAAAVGQLCSDTAGVLFGTSIESMANKCGLPPPVLDIYQRTSPSFRAARTLGGVCGIAFGCVLGMSQLLCMDLDRSDRLKHLRKLDKVFENVVADAPRLFQCERATLFVCDATYQEIWSKAVHGLEQAICMRSSSDGKGFTTWIIDHPGVINSSHPYSDPRFNPCFDRRNGFRTRSVLAAPIFGKNDQVIAIFMCVNKQQQCGGKFTAEDERLIEMLCQHLEVFMEKFDYTSEADTRMISIPVDSEVLLFNVAGEAAERRLQQLQQRHGELESRRMLQLLPRLPACYVPRDFAAAVTPQDIKRVGDAQQKQRLLALRARLSEQHQERKKNQLLLQLLPYDSLAIAQRRRRERLRREVMLQHWQAAQRQQQVMTPDRTSQHQEEEQETQGHLKKQQQSDEQQQQEQRDLLPAGIQLRPKQQDGINRHQQQQSVLQPEQQKQQQEPLYHPPQQRQTPGLQQLQEGCLGRSEASEKEEFDPFPLKRKIGGETGVPAGAAATAALVLQQPGNEGQHTTTFPTSLSSGRPAAAISGTAASPVTSPDSFTSPAAATADANASAAVAGLAAAAAAVAAHLFPSEKKEKRGDSSAASSRDGCIAANRNCHRESSSGRDGSRNTSERSSKTDGKSNRDSSSNRENRSHEECSGRASSGSRPSSSRPSSSRGGSRSDESSRSSDGEQKGSGKGICGSSRWQPPGSWLPGTAVAASCANVAAEDTAVPRGDEAQFVAAVNTSRTLSGCCSSSRTNCSGNSTGLLSSVCNTGGGMEGDSADSSRSSSRGHSSCNSSSRSVANNGTTSPTSSSSRHCERVSCSSNSSNSQKNNSSTAVSRSNSSAAVSSSSSSTLRPESTRNKTTSSNRRGRDVQDATATAPTAMNNFLVKDGNYPAKDMNSRSLFGSRLRRRRLPEHPAAVCGAASQGLSAPPPPSSPPSQQQQRREGRQQAAGTSWMPCETALPGQRLCRSLQQREQHGKKQQQQVHQEEHHREKEGTTGKKQEEEEEAGKQHSAGMQMRPWNGEQQQRQQREGMREAGGACSRSVVSGEHFIHAARREREWRENKEGPKTPAASSSSVLFRSLSVEAALRVEKRKRQEQQQQEKREPQQQQQQQQREIERGVVAGVPVGCRSRKRIVSSLEEQWLLENPIAIILRPVEEEADDYFDEESEEMVDACAAAASTAVTALEGALAASAVAAEEVEAAVASIFAPLVSVPTEEQEHLLWPSVAASFAAAKNPALWPGLLALCKTTAAALSPTSGKAHAAAAATKNEVLGSFPTQTKTRPTPTESQARQASLSDADEAGTAPAAAPAAETAATAKASKEGVVAASTAAEVATAIPATAAVLGGRVVATTATAKTAAEAVPVQTPAAATPSSSGEDAAPINGLHRESRSSSASREEEKHKQDREALPSATQQQQEEGDVLHRRKQQPTLVEAEKQQRLSSIEHRQERGAASQRQRSPAAEEEQQKRAAAGDGWQQPAAAAEKDEKEQGVAADAKQKQRATGTNEKSQQQQHVCHDETLPHVVREQQATAGVEQQGTSVGRVANVKGRSSVRAHINGDQILTREEGTEGRAATKEGVTFTNLGLVEGLYLSLRSWVDRSLLLDDPATDPATWGEEKLEAVAEIQQFGRLLTQREREESRAAVDAVNKKRLDAEVLKAVVLMRKFEEKAAYELQDFPRSVVETETSPHPLYWHIHFSHLEGGGGKKKIRQEPFLGLPSPPTPGGAAGKQLSGERLAPAVLLPPPCPAPPPVVYIDLERGDAAEEHQRERRRIHKRRERGKLFQPPHVNFEEEIARYQSIFVD